MSGAAEELRPILKVVKLQTVEYARAGRKRLAIMRTITVIDGDIAAAGPPPPPWRHRRTPENFPSPLCRDHAWPRSMRQARIARGIVDRTADQRFEQGRGQAHPILGAMRTRAAPARGAGGARARPASPGRWPQGGGIGGGAGLVAARCPKNAASASATLAVAAGWRRADRANRARRPARYRDAARSRSWRRWCHQIRRREVPAFDPERPPHPFEMAAASLVPKSLRSKPRAMASVWQAGIGGAAPGQGVIARIRGDGEGGIEEGASGRWAKLRLRPAGAALVEAVESRARGIGGPGLLLGIDGEGTSRPAIDIDDGVQRCRLLRAPHDHDRQLEPAGIGVIVVPRDADRAAAKARRDFGRDTWQIRKLSRGRQVEAAPPGRWHAPRVQVRSRAAGRRSSRRISTRPAR